MKWAWRCGRLFGIDLYVHVTFLILLSWVAASYLFAGDGLLQALARVFFILLLFGIVVCHELGHALTARHFGIRTRDITLLPIGGVARLERMPEKPIQELLVACAGPAVNVALALTLLGLLRTSPEPLAPSPIVGSVGEAVAQLFWINVMLAGFNLLPAFPMDGGRVLRAVLAMRMDYVRATRRAATIGQGLALAMGFVGLFYNPFLAFIALFVWVGAADEAAAAQMNSALRNIPIRDVMITDYRTVSPRDPLARVADYIVAGFQDDFPVVADDKVVGVLGRSDLLVGLSDEGPEAEVGQIMQRQFQTAEPSETAEGVLARVQDMDRHSLPVTRNGRLVGMVTKENLDEFIAIHGALANSHGRQSTKRIN